MNEVSKRQPQAAQGQNSAGMRRQTALVDGLQLNYFTAGEGPPLLMLHGLVGSARNWFRNLDFLAQSRTVYLPDLANCGRSERVRGLDPSLEAHAQRVGSFMDAVGLHAADVLAHSYGAATAMLLAARSPHRVRRMVLFAPANPFCSLGRPQMRFYATPLGSLFASRVIPRLPRVLHRRSLERLYGDPRRMGEGVLEGYTDGLDRGAIEHILAVMLRWREDMALLESVLPRLRGLPIQLVWGDLDRAVALRSGQELANRIGATLRTVPGTGHVSFEELPDVSNAVLGEWLSD